MANALYDLAREGFLDGTLTWAGTILVSLYRSSGGGAGPYYTINLATHDFHNDIPDNGDCRPIGTGQGIGQAVTPTTPLSNGVADGSDVTFTAVASGNAIQLIIAYKNVGTQATDPLIFAIDTATGLPVTPNGGDITVQWDNAANRIFKL